MYGLLHVLNFSHGQILTIGAYAFYAICVEQYSGSFELVPLLATGLGCLTVLLIVSFISLKAFILPFQSYSTLLPFVATLALGTIIESVISMGFGVNVKSLTTGHETQSISILSALVTPYQIIIIVSAFVILAIVATIIHSTPLGRKIRAISQNSYAASSIGISQKGVSYFIFAISTVIAGYAGILAGITTNVQPTMGNAYTIKAFAAMVLGGLGNVWGTMIGSYLLGFIENLSLGIDIGGYSLPSGYKDAFAFLIILLVLLVKPDGLFNFKSRKV